MGPDRPGIRDTLRLPDAAVRALLFRAQLEADGPAAAAGRRASTRYIPPKHHPVLLELERPGEGAVVFRAALRNVSQGGASVLVGLFIHPGTPCHLTLRTVDSENLCIAAAIRRCVHVTGRVHELGLKFTQPLDQRLLATIVPDAADEA